MRIEQLNQLFFTNSSSPTLLHQLFFTNSSSPTLSASVDLFIGTLARFSQAGQ
jgi:hypothetical protein